MAKERCLREGVDAPDLVTAKDFLRFHVATSRGKIVAQLTTNSINTFTEWLFANFTRVTGTPTDTEERSEVHNVSCHTTVVWSDMSDLPLVGAKDPHSRRFSDCKQNSGSLAMKPSFGAGEPKFPRLPFLHADTSALCS
jgi:hypothetical protein